MSEKDDVQKQIDDLSDQLARGHAALVGRMELPDNFGKDSINEAMSMFTEERERELVAEIDKLKAEKAALRSAVAPFVQYIKTAEALTFKCNHRVYADSTALIVVVTWGEARALVKAVEEV